MDKQGEIYGKCSTGPKWISKQNGEQINDLAVYLYCEVSDICVTGHDLESGSKSVKVLPRVLKVVVVV